MKDDNYYAVFGWMINNLHLKGMEKDAFAIIYGFSQDNSSEYHGSLSYLADAIGCAKSTVQKVLKSLEDKGFISKNPTTINNITFNYYSAIVDSDYIYDTVKNEVYRKSVGYTEKEHGVYRKSVGGVPKIGTNNIDDNINYITEKKDIYSSDDSYISKEKSESPSKKKRFTGINPTLDQVETLIKAKGYHFDARDIIRYYTSDGEYDVWRFRDGRLVKDWKRCCITFEDRWQEKFGNGYKPSAKTFQPSDYDEEADKRHIEELIRKQRENYQEMVERGEINEYDRVPY